MAVKGILVEDDVWTTLTDATFSSWNQTAYPGMAVPGQIDIFGGTDGWLITDDKADASMYMSQPAAGSRAAGQYIFSMYIKKDDDESRFPMMRITSGNQTVRSQFIVNTKTGATLTADGANYTGEHGSVDEGEWWRFWGELQHGASGTISLQFRPAATISWADELTSGATGSVIACAPQVENTEMKYPSSVVKVQGTRDQVICEMNFADMPGMPSSLANDFCGQIVWELESDVVRQKSYATAVRIGSFTEGLRCDHNSTSSYYRTYHNTDGRNENSSVSMGSLRGSISDFRFRKSSVTGYDVWANGVKKVIAADELSDFLTPATKVEIALGNGHHATYKKVRIVPAALSDQEIEAWT
ncbi:hypothetical protein N9937_01370 [bacterium]|nr:hypothetical protein [bacterium]